MKKKSTPKVPDSNEIVPNKAAPVAAPKLETLADYYGHYYKTMFNKLDKEAQESLTANLAKGVQLVRGEKREFENVRTFVRDVIEKAEVEYDKVQAKKQKDAKPVTEEK
jgi:hypothetical protein